MLNSLANHGFLHHSGLNISVEDLVDAFDHALNLSPDSTLPVAQLAVTTSTTGNSNTLNLDDLDTHGGTCSRTLRFPHRVVFAPSS
jgi:hypothetical protein